MAVGKLGRTRMGAFFVALFIATSVTAAPLRLVSYNVWYGFTKTPERKIAWLNWVKQQAPDVVSLQELNGYDPGKLMQDASKWGHSNVAFLSKSDFCMGLTSRQPISDVKRIVDGMHHGLLRCKVGEIYYYVIHFHPSNCVRRVAEAKRLLADAETLPTDASAVLVGDFNGFSPMDQPHYDADERIVPFFERRDNELGERNLFQHAIDYRGVKIFLDAGYVDLVAKHRNTFSGSFPTRLRHGEDHGTDRRLDYVLVRPGLGGKSSSARIIRNETTAMLSDHYPVVVDFEL